MPIPALNSIFRQDIVDKNKMLIESSKQYIFASNPSGGCGLTTDVIVFCLDDMALFWQNSSGTPEPDYRRVMRTLMHLRDCMKISSGVMTYDPTIRPVKTYTGTDGIIRKWVIELNDELCSGYGGGAYNGQSWCAISKDLVKPLIDTAYNIVPVLPQVFLYENGRSCYDLILDTILDWELSSPMDYGFWTLGFNGAMTVLIPESLGAELNYAGQNVAMFRADRLKDLNRYTKDTTYTFDNTWSSTLLPWNNYQSVNDLMSGMLIDLSDKFGGLKFLTRVFYRLKQEPATPSKTDRYKRANNLYTACRNAAFDMYDDKIADDLILYFKDFLRWEFVGSW